MRIIGGDLKGRAILPPSSFRARPTTDFAKEGLFNVLNNMVDFEELSVLDLFSGTGGISYEFASRGCTDIISIEMNPVHADFIKKSVAVLKIQGMQVVRHNVFDFLNICTKKFDLIFADPPYDIEGLDTIPDKIFSKNILNDNAIVIVEHPASYNFENHPNFKKMKRYGNVHFSFFEKSL